MANTWKNRNCKHTKYDRPSNFKEHVSTTEFFGCVGKTSFKYEKEALAGARAMDYLPHALYPYKCRSCKKWHLTRIHPSQFY